MNGMVFLRPAWQLTDPRRCSICWASIWRCRCPFLTPVPSRMTELVELLDDLRSALNFGWYVSFARFRSAHERWKDLLRAARPTRPQQRCNHIERRRQKRRRFVQELYA